MPEEAMSRKFTLEEDAPTVEIAFRRAWDRAECEITEGYVESLKLMGMEVRVSYRTYHMNDSYSFTFEATVTE
jgi:hypothetical protein